MTIPESDAWLLARLLSDQPVDGEVGRMSDGLRPIAEHLAALPIDRREAAWSGWLAGRSDQNALILAVSDAEPTGPRPAPEADVEAAGARPGGVVIRRASDIEPLAVEWLWKDRVPLGMLSLFAGDPKCGKSFTTVDLAASVSRGAAPPFGDPPDGPAGVVVLNAEDDPARTIVPRLKAAGADLSRVHIIEAVRLADGTEALPSLRSDVERIGEAAARMGDCRLIVIDPVSAYLGGTDDHRNGELRGVLSPLKALAERLGLAVVLVTHLNKGAGTNGKHRVTGSIAYVGACRANFLFVRDREDPTGRRVLMLDNGCNLSDSVPTLAFRIEDRGNGPAVSWEAEPVDVNVEQALRAESEKRREGDHSEARECDRWLRECLASGPVGTVELLEDGRSAGFSRDQLKRAKERIGARSRRIGFGRDSKCHWSLAIERSPDDPEGRP